MAPPSSPSPHPSPDETHSVDGPITSTRGPGDRAVFRVPPAALVAAVFLALCLSPIAFLGGWWFALFALPLAVVVAVFRVRTTVDSDGVHVRGLVTTTTLRWPQVATLRVGDRAWVRAVPVDGVRGQKGGEGGRDLVLTCVRVRDLNRVGEASGGWITVPSPAEVAAAQEHRRELEATRMRVAQLREALGEQDEPRAGEQEPAPQADQAAQSAPAPEAGR